MPRIAEPRVPAAPTTPRQHARREAILRAATSLGARHELERVQMQEVAADAGVALSTLYRYFPSKTHLFVGVMADRVAEMAGRFGDRDWSDHRPNEAVFEIVRSASRALLARPTLAVAMMQSLNSADPAVVTDVPDIDERLTALLLRAAGVTEPGEAERTLMRLVLQSWYGVLQQGLNGRISPQRVEDDIRVACRLLLAPLGEDRDRAAVTGAL